MLLVILFVAANEKINKANKQNKNDSQIIVEIEDKINFFSLSII